MDSNDCFLNICIIYNKKYFNIKTDLLISIDEIKEKIVEHYNLKEDDKKYMKFCIINDEKEIIISSENDIIQYCDDTDIDNPKLNLNLLIEEHENNIDSNFQSGETTSSVQNNETNINNQSMGETEIIRENLDKYDELKNIIEVLTIEIKTLKDEQINKSKNIEENYLNLKNEIEECKNQIKLNYNNRNKQNEENESIKNKIEEEFNNIKEENSKIYNNMELLFKNKENEFINFKNQINESTQNEIKIMTESIKNKINEVNNELSKKIFILEEKAKTFELKDNNTNNLSIIELEEKTKNKIQNMEKIYTQYIQDILIRLGNHNKFIGDLEEKNKKMEESYRFELKQLKDIINHNFQLNVNKNTSFLSQIENLKTEFETIKNNFYKKNENISETVESKITKDNLNEFNNNYNNNDINNEHPSLKITNKNISEIDGGINNNNYKEELKNIEKIIDDKANNCNKSNNHLNCHLEKVKKIKLDKEKINQIKNQYEKLKSIPDEKIQILLDKGYDIDEKFLIDLMLGQSLNNFG